MRRIIDFGKIDYYKKGRRNNRITVEMKLNERNNKKIFSVTGCIWNSKKSDIVCGGQCLDELVEFLGEDTLFMEIHRLWKTHHMNDFHAECEHQHELGWDHTKDRSVIGKPCPVCGYEYGTSWLYVPIPEEDIKLIEKIITTGNLSVSV